jgi:tetratricopeptide (TPR) repeat protein
MKKVLVLFLSALLFSCGKESTAPKKLPQIIVAPKISNVLQNSADITWETDIAATSVVRYGEKAGTYDYSIRNDAQDTQHVIRLSNLKSNIQYFFIAESATKDGSTTSAEFNFTTLPSLDQLFTLAWSAFQQKQYATAITYFTRILKDNTKNVSAMTGLGWCYASSAVDTLSRSLYYFDLALSVEAAYNDALAGRGLVLLALKAYNKTIEDLEKVLRNNPAYVFSYDSSVDYRDLRLALAMAYYYKMDYVNCQTHINVLAPGNNLNPEQAATWVVDGVTYSSYAEALLARIEKIRRG